MSIEDGSMDACPACGVSNPPGSRFCGSCGANLAPVEPCPSCGAENPAGQSFCNSCGARLPAQPAAAEPAVDKAPPEIDGERKQVTVLFADVKGSMDLAEQVDPEEWRDDHAALLLAPLRRRPPLRGHRRQVHRRRDHGPVRRPDRARGPRAPRLLRGPSHRASSSPSMRPSCAARTGSTSRSGSGSTPARWWPARSARTLSPSTRRSATPSASRSGWRRSPSPARRT